MKSAASLTLVVLLLTHAVVHAQATKIVVDPTPGGSPCTGDVLNPSIGFFTSTTVPSIIVGRGEYICTAQGGMFLSYSTGSINGPWHVSTIEPNGDHYERAMPFTYKSDTYPGIITSEGSGQVTKWFYNPLNWRGNPTQPWPSEVIANAPCHDMHVADIDGDGRLDVVCSSTEDRGDSGGYIAYQNNYNDWSVVHNSTPLVSDGIAIVRISNIWDIAVSNAGATFLYINPRTYGRNPRTTTWQAYKIGPGAEGTSLEGGMLSGQPVIYECSNETGYVGPWSYGCVMFQPVGTSYTSPWKLTEIDSTYRDAHEINAAIYPQGPATYNSNGIPNLPTWLNGFVVGEQEQASSVCNREGLNEHPNISGCRVTYFRYDGNGRFTPIALSRLGTHSQSIIAYHGGYAVAGANHDVFGAVDPTLNMWLLDASGGNLGPPSTSTLTPGNYHVGSLYSGHYWVIDGGFFTSYWGFPPAAEAFPENGTPIGANPWQQFTFAASGSRFTICDVTKGACLTDGGGAVEIGQGTDTWAVAQDGAGWSIRDTRTGRYMGVIPDVSRGNVPMASSAIAISLK
jgi:hypothetical protein